MPRIMEWELVSYLILQADPDDPETLFVVEFYLWKLSEMECNYFRGGKAYP